MNNGYLLLVEDDPAVQENNKEMLDRRGYNLKQAFTLAEARTFIAEELPEAIVLDIQLPDGNGLTFLEEFRKISNAPVLMLTAMGTPEDIILGLEAGGDYYLTKPHQLDVFLKNVEALLRRAAMIPETLRVGPLRLEPASGKAYLNGKDMALSQKEYALLQQFVQRPEHTMSADYLYEKAWGQKMIADDTSLKSIVYRLRKKMEGCGYTITAERGEGYILERE